MNTSTPHNDLAWMLDGLVEIPHVDFALVFSTDGLVIQKSTALPQDDADLLAAGASSVYSAAAGSGRPFGSGPVQQVVIEYDGRTMFLAAAGPNARLAVVCEQAVDMGTVAYEVSRLVAQIGEYLGTQSRSVLPSGNGHLGSGHG